MTNTPSPPAAGVDQGRDLTRFAPVNAWVFDLDNTLYPRSTNLYEQVDKRIRDYVGKLLKLRPEEAQRVQKDYYRRYGTTLRGLMVERGITPDDFLEYVHDIDHTPVEPDPRLATAIARLPGRKFIFTNGSRTHAEKIAKRLGFTTQFEDIFDIVRLKLLPKPGQQAYDSFIAETKIVPGEAAMFEDLSRNLVVPHALGMATVLVVPGGTRQVFTEDWELEGRDAKHVDYVTDDLGGFLESVSTAISAGAL